MCCCDILEALHILVIDLFHYEPTKSCFCTTIGDWLDLITSRILKPRIMIVPTHLDEFDSSDRSEVKNRCDDILERVRQYSVAQIALIDREISEKKKKGLKNPVQCGSDPEWKKKNPPIISSVLNSSPLSEVSVLPQSFSSRKVWCLIITGTVIIYFVYPSKNDLNHGVTIILDS